MRLAVLLLLLVALVTAQDYLPHRRNAFRQTAGSLPAPTWVSAEGTNIAATASPIVHYPADTQNNDILIAVFATDSAHDASGTPPTGWAKILESDTADESLSAFWKRCDGTEGDNETWTSIFAATESGRAVVFQVRGCVSSGSPVDASSPESEETNRTDHDMGPLATVTDNCLVFGMIGADAPSGATFTWDGGITERIDSDTTPSGQNAALGLICIGSIVQASAGNVSMGGDCTSSVSAGQALIALKP